MLRFVRVCILVAIAAACAQRAGAQTILYVNNAVPASGNGSSWSTAFKFLQEAIEAAEAVASPNNRVELWVASGVYRRNAWNGPPSAKQIEREWVFIVPRYVSLRGGFRGIETYPEDRDWTAPPAILSGDLRLNDNGTLASLNDNSFTILKLAPGADALIEGFTIEGAYQDDGQGERATAINSKSANLLLRNCIIRNNRNTSFFGTTIHFESDLVENRARFENCIFHHNVANVGSAVDAVLSDVTFINCTIADNTATTTSATPNWLFGAALTRFNGNFTIINSIIWNNTCGNAQTNLNCGWTRSSVLQPVSWFCGTFPRFADPLFVNPAAGDYRLQPNSPAIDAGEAFFLPPDLEIDIEGRARTFNVAGSTPCADGNCVDAGAHEFGAPPLISSNERLWATTFTSFHNPSSWIGNIAPGLFDVGVFDNLVTRIYAGVLSHDATIGGAKIRGGTLNLDISDGSLTLQRILGLPQTGLLVVSDPRDIDARLNLRTALAGPTSPIRRLEARDVVVAETDGSFGQITLDGRATRLITTRSLRVGVGADGPSANDTAVIVSHNAALNASGDLIIAQGLGSRARVNITNLGSALLYTGGPGTSFIVGDQGVGELSITDGARVSILSSDRLIVGNTASAAGSSLRIDADAQLNITSANFLVIGDTAGADLIMQPGATIDTLGGVYVGRNGRFLGGGRITGNVTNFGQFGIGDSASANLGGVITLGALNIEGDYRQIGPSSGGGPESSGRLVIDLSDFGQSDLLVARNAELGGLLQIRFSEGFAPASGDSFQPLEVASINGRFDVAFFPRFSDSTADSRFMRIVYPSPAESGFGLSLVVDSLGSLVDLSSAQDYAIGGTPTAAALGDLDSDGDTDLAVALPGATPAQEGQVLILFNQTNNGATFNGFELGSTTINVGRQPSAIVIADLDNNPGKDLAVANAGDDNVQIFANTNGQGLSFPLASTISVGDQPSDLDAVDLDGDSDLDLITANRGSDNLTLIDNDASALHLIASFHVRGNIAAGDEPVDVDPVDLDNDKDLDIIVANFGAGTISFATNDGGGNFPQQSNLPVGNGPSHVKAVPLDNDPYPDIVTVDQLGNTVSVLRSTGKLEFAPSVQLQDIGNDPSSLAALDLDADGDLDLAIIADDPNDAVSTKVVRILRNDSIADQPISLTQPVNLRGGANPAIVLTGDVDNSGVDDLVTINDDTASALLGDNSDNDLSVLINNVPPPTPPACPGDANHDNLVNGLDLSVLLSQFGNAVTPGTGADYNSDAQVDGRDLSVLLANYGTSC